MSQTQHQPADADSPQELSCNDCGKHSRCFLERKNSGAHSHYRKAIEDKSSGVVSETFSFQDDEDSPG